MNLPDGYLLQGKKYRLTRMIGQGGFGITYLGIWNTEVKGGLGALKTTVPVCIKEYFFKDYCYRDNNSFAVKVHSITGEKLFGKFKEKLIEEANILSAVHHQNIVNVLEVFEENNTAYIVMEYISGNSLKYLLDKRGVLPETEVIKYTHQIGNALTFVHEKNIVHLDIKPGNILIDKDFNARLIDFGVSKRYDIEEQDTSTTTLTLSKGFASIEQYDNDEMMTFSPAPDIYSLGATMYNLLTGVIPVESILRATKQMLPPSAYKPSISQKTENAILKAMEIKPKDRFRKVNELLASIDAPDYDFIPNKLDETNRRIDDDQTVILKKPINNLSDDEDDKTILNSPNGSKSKRKTKPRNVVRRRVLFTAIILLFAFVGYAVFSYFVAITSSKVINDGISMPDDRIPDDTFIAAVNQIDSADLIVPAQPDSGTVSSEQNTAIPTQVTNTSTQPANTPTPVTNTLTASTTQPATNNTSTTRPKEETIPRTPAYTVAQIDSMENVYQGFLSTGKAKSSTGGFKGAQADFEKASEVAKKIGKNTSEINLLIAETKQQIEMEARGVKQDNAVDMNDYVLITTWDELKILRNIKTQAVGAINASGEIVILFIYKHQSRSVGNNRSFIRFDDGVDLYNSKGEKVQ